MNLYSRLSVTVALFLFCLQSAWADPLQAVVLERQGDRVTINKGIEDGVQMGQTWHLGNNARLVVEVLREHSATGSLDGEATVGTIASLGREAPRVASNDVRERMNNKRQSSEQSLESLRKKYRRALSGKTESHGFATPTPGQYSQVYSTGLEAYSLYSLYDISNSIGLDPTGAFINPLYIATTAAGMYQRNKMTNDMLEAGKVRVDVEATLWTEELVDLRSEVQAAEQGLSVQEALNKKVQNIVESGVDKYVVLEIRVKNVGQNPAELAPFKYRVFLMSAEDQPIAASRIDAVLDKTLQPGEEIRGMAYFPQIVAAGQSKLRFAFEQMFGDRATMTFSSN